MNATITSSDAEWINDLCLPKDWETGNGTALFRERAQQSAAVGFTPCFEQLVIMSPVYIIVIILSFIR
jgi:hypothetical protein